MSGVPGPPLQEGRRLDHQRQAIFEARRAKFYTAVAKNMWKDELERVFWKICSDAGSDADLDSIVQKFVEQEGSASSNTLTQRAKGAVVEQLSPNQRGSEDVVVDQVSPKERGQTAWRISMSPFLQDVMDVEINAGNEIAPLISDLRLITSAPSPEP